MTPAQALTQTLVLRHRWLSAVQNIRLWQSSPVICGWKRGLCGLQLRLVSTMAAMVSSIVSMSSSRAFHCTVYPLCSTSILFSSTGSGLILRLRLKKKSRFVSELCPTKVLLLTPLYIRLIIHTAYSLRTVPSTGCREQQNCTGLTSAWLEVVHRSHSTQRVSSTPSGHRLIWSSRCPDPGVGLISCSPWVGVPPGVGSVPAPPRVPPGCTALPQSAHRLTVGCGWWQFLRSPVHCASSKPSDRPGKKQQAWFLQIRNRVSFGGRLWTKRGTRQNLFFFSANWRRRTSDLSDLHQMYDDLLGTWSRNKRNHCHVWEFRTQTCVQT